ncbi:MAG: extracellular solute-binding protein [Myxococcales bacterium]|nr:extracellular solute-binding protein [Myxococcales bacterium]MCB9520575.1 extracellular solute-binding protein [Myxococcales bacterium]MCB9531498.1 extracellular solute-binding protein [Myxococcales bacterium]
MLALFALAGTTGCGRVAEPDVVLWHAYRGAEAEALVEVVHAFEERHPEVVVEVVPVPYQAYANKLTSGVPRGNGPDVFLFAQERIGAWADAGILHALEPTQHRAVLEALPGGVVDACRYDGELWGLPVATKTTALFYRSDRLDELGAEPPETTDDLVALAARFTDASAGRFGLVYPVGDFYFHSGWFFGFGGTLSDADGTPRLDAPSNANSFAFVADLLNERRVVPRDCDYGVAKDLFARGDALFAVNGPWFLGELGDDVPFGVVPLPRISATNTPASPFVTVESVLVSSQAARSPEALAAATLLADFIAGPESSVIRAERGGQVVADRTAALSAREPAASAAFGAAAAAGTPMPNAPEMTAIWEPLNRALDQTLRGSRTAEAALVDADADLRRALAPPPPPTSPLPYEVAFGLVLVAAAGLAVRRSRRTALLARMRTSRLAYLYVAPAAIASGLLIFLPFIVGASLSLYAHEQGEFSFVGFANFLNILLARDFGLTHPQSFYFTLVVTVAWTAANVVLHVSIGLALALALRDSWVRLRGVYRVLLIVPWAVPNYITALIWKSMFNFSFGSINGVLRWLGATPVDWFSKWSTAFAANVATNTWLGFPFMMVVSLGALQSIPRDLEDAAEVDGASRWQRFRHITLPLLRPALVPAVVLGTVWTFNMFNIIYLVSGGGPDASTDILITEAYRWAFERGERYGYAAAYGVLIFGVLLIYTWATSGRRATELTDG